MTSIPTTELLDFEREHERHTSRKEWLIMKNLGLRPARYYQLLLRAARSLEGWAEDPMLCDRIVHRQVFNREVPRRSLSARRDQAAS